MSIDAEIQSRVDAYSGNPQALAQRYGMTQELFDLLALQAIKSQKDAAQRQMAMQMQGMGTVKDQVEGELRQRTQQEIAESVGKSMPPIAPPRPGMPPGTRPPQPGTPTTPQGAPQTGGVGGLPMPNIQKGFAEGGIVEPEEDEESSGVVGAIKGFTEPVGNFFEQLLTGDVDKESYINTKTPADLVRDLPEIIYGEERLKRMADEVAEAEESGGAGAGLAQRVRSGIGGLGEALGEAVAASVTTKNDRKAATDDGKEALPEGSTVDPAKKREGLAPVEVGVPDIILDENPSEKDGIAALDNEEGGISGWDAFSAFSRGFASTPGANPVTSLIQGNAAVDSVNARNAKLAAETEAETYKRTQDLLDRMDARDDRRVELLKGSYEAARESYQDAMSAVREDPRFLSLERQLQVQLADEEISNEEYASMLQDLYSSFPDLTVAASQLKTFEEMMKQELYEFSVDEE